MRHACLAGIFLAGLHIISFGEISATAAQKAAPQEEDDASLLQVQISSQQEHLLEEVKSEVAVRDTKTDGRTHVASQGLQEKSMSLMKKQRFEKPQDTAGHEMNELNDHKAPTPRYSLSLLQSFNAARLVSFQRNSGDQSIVVVAVAFFVLVCVAGTLIWCIVDIEKKDVVYKSFDSRSMPREGSLTPRAQPMPVAGKMSPAGGNFSRQSSGKSSTGMSSGSELQSASPEFVAAVQPPTPGSPLGTAISKDNSMVQGGLPLCPEFVVPDRTQLACIVRANLCRTQQSQGFEVRNVTGIPFCRIVVSELSAGQKPGIYLKTLDDAEMLGFLSTEEIWAMPEGTNPSLSIYRQSNALYGTIQKNSSGAYAVLRGKTSLMRLTGDFHRNHIKVVTSTGRVCATATPISSEEFQVHVQSGTDAGLILLAILAANKLERPAPYSERPASYSERPASYQLVPSQPQSLPQLPSQVSQPQGPGNNWAFQSGKPSTGPAQPWNQSKIVVWSKITINMLNQDPANKLRIFQERWEMAVDYMDAEHRDHLLQYFKQTFQVYPANNSRSQGRGERPAATPAFVRRPTSSWINSLIWAPPA